LTAFVFILAALLAGGVWAGAVTQLFNDMASRALAARDSAAAERWLSWSQRLGQIDGRAELLWARLARRRHDYEGVRAHLQRAMKLDSPRELVEREEWLVLAQMGRLREAEPHLPRLLSDPRDDGSEICEAYVDGYLMTYQTGKAQFLLGGWERDFPDDPLPHLIRGGLSAATLEWTAAEASYRKALELAPDNSEAALGLANVLAAQKQYEKALDWYRKGQKGMPPGPEARLGVARCLQALGRLDEAREKLIALTRDHPDSAPALLALAQSELVARNDSRARELLDRALERDPRNPEIRHALATVLRRAGETDAADAQLSEAKAIGAAKIRAEELFKKIAARPDDVSARYELGTLQFRYGSEREGLLMLKSVLQFEPGHTAATEAIERYEHGPH
jgi:tetratricopeptide (TPR) repeat protein